MFGVDPDSICTEGGSIHLLVGQDNGRFLLKPICKIKSREMLNIAMDLSLHTSMATKQLSICGAIGGKSSITDSSGIYRVNMISGHFILDKPPSSGDLTNLIGSLPQSTYSVKKSSADPTLQGPSFGRKPDDDSNGDSHQPQFTVIICKILYWLWIYLIQADWSCFTLFTFFSPDWGA